MFVALALPMVVAALVRLPSLLMVMTRTGLEPATSAVTGRRANQLRYRALMNIKKYSCHISGSYVTFKAVVTCVACPQRDSNPCYRRERAMS